MCEKQGGTWVGDTVTVNGADSNGQLLPGNCARVYLDGVYQGTTCSTGPGQASEGKSGGGNVGGVDLLKNLTQQAQGLIHKLTCAAVSPLLKAADTTNGAVGTGLGGSFGIGLGLGVSGSGSIEVVADPNHNVGLAFTGGGNPGYGVVGVGAQAGRQFTVSNASTIFDLRGPYVGGSTSIMTVGVSVAQSGDVTTGTLTFGPGVGGRVSGWEAGGTAVPSSLAFNCNDVIP